jgi:hypothetical protein
MEEHIFVVVNGLRVKIKMSYHIIINNETSLSDVRRPPSAARRPLCTIRVRLLAFVCTTVLLDLLQVSLCGDPLYCTSIYCTSILYVT